MYKNTLDDPQYAMVESLAVTFERTGRTGFWAQLVLGTFPVVVMAFVLFYAGSLSGTRAGVPIVEWLAMGNILLLFFTTFWFHRYRALGKRIADPASRPTGEEVAGKVWTGLMASGLGILVLVQKRARERGLSSRLLNTQHNIRSLLALTKLEGLFEFV